MHFRKLGSLGQVVASYEGIQHLNSKKHGQFLVVAVFEGDIDLWEIEGRQIGPDDWEPSKEAINTLKKSYLDDFDRLPESITIYEFFEYNQKDVQMTSNLRLPTRDEICEMIESAEAEDNQEEVKRLEEILRQQSK